MTDTNAGVRSTQADRFCLVAAPALGGGLLSAVLLLSLLIGSPGVSRALEPAKQIDQYGHDVWTSQRGLPGEAVYQIMQSPDGYLWLRTSGGLVRFDGVRFVSMDSAVGSEPVKALAMSASGDLLIRTTSRTVIYKGGAFTDYRPIAPLPDGEIKSLFESRQQEVLIGADDFLYLADRSGIRLLRSATAWVSSFLQDESGVIWAGNAAGLLNYRAGAVSAAAGTTKTPVFALAEDHQHQIWVGGTNRLYALDRSHGTAYRLNVVDAQQINSQVNAIAEDREGNLWIGTSASGLVRRRGDAVSSFGAINGLSDNRVLSIFEDREGSLWVGTGAGLDRFRDTKITTYTSYENLPSDTTRTAIAGADGSIFVICDNGGLAQITDRAIIATTKIPGMKLFNGSTMYRASDGAVWIGSMSGLVRLKDGKFTRYGGDPRFDGKFIPAISGDDESLIFATSDTLAYRFVNGKVAPFTIGGQTTPLSVPGNYTFAIYRDTSATLWFGTVKGLFRFAPGEPPASAQVKQIDFPVTSISDDGRGSLWLGGRTPGLTRYRTADGRVTHYKKKDGLFDDYPTSVLYDITGNLWISTSNGIFSADRKDLDDFADGRTSWVHTVAYGIADGMKTSEASTSSAQPGGVQGADGRLWFTTAKGIVSIDPGSIRHNDLVPPIVMESVVVDGSPIGAGDFVVPPGKDKIEFHYTALSFLNPDRVHFRYQLQGYDQQWVNAGTQRVAYYNNLAPGSYRFRVIAANDDGVWNDVGASVGFVMRPHFYQTSWFWVLCTMYLLLVVVAAYRLNTRLLRRRAAELSRLVEERTVELRKSAAELEESKRHLEQVAFLDSLTALPNRRMFAQELRNLLALSRRRDECFSVLMIDLDQFKQTNDTLGHDAGDALLIEAASRLKAAVRETDCVARLGGDEFAILLVNDHDAASIDVICRRILDNFLPVAPYNGAELKTTPSIGIAKFPNDAETQEALCKAADMALYQAKRAGGNSWYWYQPDRAEQQALIHSPVVLSEESLLPIAGK